jgi:hypothetical protein
MTIDTIGFLHSYCLFAQAQAGAQTPAIPVFYLSSDRIDNCRNLWRGRAIENVELQLPTCLDPFAVIRDDGGGSSATSPEGNMRLLLKVVASIDDAGRQYAQSLFEAFARGTGTQAGMELRSAKINGYLAGGMTANGHWQIVDVRTRSRPGLVGRDEEGRAIFVGNFDVNYYKLLS